MKFTRTTLLLPATAVLARELATTTTVVRQTDVETITDEYLFDITLDQFETYRDAEDPDTVDWTSDGCTDSPDNPLGFDFVPACHRHDFGYTNYRAQSRFTTTAKAAIDSNFLSDLQYQCESETFESICDALAEVYYAAVRAFGGDDATPGKRASSSDLVAAYEDKLSVYNHMLQDAKDAGRIPANTTLAHSQVQDRSTRSTISRKSKRSVKLYV